MNTEAVEFYEDTLMQLGHIAAEIAQALTFLGEQEANPSVISEIKLKVLQNDHVFIQKLQISEQAIREVRQMIDAWTASARARLQ